MTDVFGINAMLTAGLNHYINDARRTGRTDLLVSLVNDGDRVHFTCTNHARNFTQRCKDVGKSVETVVSNPRTPEDVFRKGSSQGRVWFDHCWIEEHYRWLLERAGFGLNQLARESGGYGDAHRRTREQARNAKQAATDWKPETLIHPSIKV